jgi:hypothetical protein
MNGKFSMVTASNLPTGAATASFGSEFLEDHAGQLITSPLVALIELVANAWDAGANLVDIQWPKQSVPELFRISDDGTGMTPEEFSTRWLELAYNRKATQGEDVLFPADNQHSRRKAYGRNGKGRHSAFCFTSQYYVETWRDGMSHTYSITKPVGRSNAPFNIKLAGSVAKDCHGTSIFGELARNHVPVETIRDLIGSKFIADPSFRIVVNGEPIEFTDLSHLQDEVDITVSSVGTVKLITVDTRRTMRKGMHHGVAWWVNRRLVGDISWRGFDDHRFLDGRMSLAKRYTFIVEADVLIDEILPDWTGFRPTRKPKAVQDAVADAIAKTVLELYRDEHRAKKLAALEPVRQALSELPSNVQHRIGQFVNGVQEAVPTIQQRELSATVQVLVNLEHTRTGATLLYQLAQLNPAEMDKLSELLNKWSIEEVSTIVGELEWRLKVIEKLEHFVEDKNSNELHDIHPLFERGLWIFGPEYESVSYQSNRALLSIVRDWMKSSLNTPLSAPQRRPDIIAIPDATLSLHSADSFDPDTGDVNGIANVLLIELKRGGFTITRNEKRQAADYVYELRKSSKVGDTTKIKAFVLGAKVDLDALLDTREGEHTVICARPYQVILRQAYARSFHLLEKLRKVREERQQSDPEVAQVLSQNEQSGLWDLSTDFST